MAPHIALSNDGEITGTQPEQAPLLLTGLPSSDVHQFHGGIVQVAARIGVQHVITRQRPMWALGVSIRDDAGERMVCQRGCHVDRAWEPISIGGGDVKMVCKTI